jgi:hypothetical protein
MGRLVRYVLQNSSLSKLFVMNTPIVTPRCQLRYAGSSQCKNHTISIKYPACLGAVPSGEGKRTARNLRAVYCVVGDVSLGVVSFLGSCFVVRGFEGWRIAVYTPLLDVAVDISTSVFDVAVSLCIYRRVRSLI